MSEIQKLNDLVQIFEEIGPRSEPDELGWTEYECSVDEWFEQLNRKLQEKGIK